MIDIRCATAADRPALFALWKEAFGDSEDFIADFFNTAYCDCNCRILSLDSEIAAALYIIDCHLASKPIAYVYAVATAKRFRNKGLCALLTANTHDYLKERGYVGEILVPATAELFSFYSKLGYKTVGYADTLNITAQNPPAELKKLSPAEYKAIRRRLLPENAVDFLDDGYLLLDTLADFYLTENTLIAAEKRKDKLFVHELLGEKSVAPRVLAALNIKSGTLRTLGQTPFLMGYSLGGDIENVYLGIAFD